MADPVWGMLPKSQDDPTTIDEAIAAAIAAHEADPTSHLGDGESLETHRANDVLDHPAGSALSDKQTLSEIVFNSDMNPASGWDTDHFTFDFPQVHTSFAHNGQTSAYIESGNVRFLVGPSLEIIDNLYKIAYNFNGDNDIANIYGGMGSVSDPNDNYAISFKIISGEIYFIATFGDTVSYSSPIALAASTDYLITAVVSAADNAVIFYLNGSEVYRRTIPTLSDWSLGNFTIITTRNYNPSSGHGLNIAFGPVTISNGTL